MSLEWIGSGILALFLYRIWLLKTEKRDRFIVEWRTLNPEGRDLFPVWRGSSGLDQVTLGLRGLAAPQIGRIVRGNDWVASRTFRAFDTLDAAKLYYVDVETYEPIPHFAACAAFLWTAQSSDCSAAIKAVHTGAALLLQKSKVLYTEAEE